MASTDFTIRILGDGSRAVEAVDKVTGSLNTGMQKWSNASAAIAGAVGGAVASITGRAMDALGDLVGEAAAASDATDKFKQTLGFAGLDTGAIDGAMTKAQAYADATVYDLSTIQNTTAQLAANGIGNYSELTEAAGNLNAVAGGNADTFKSVAGVLTQTAGQGKLTTENWNQLSDAIPGASGRLQEALKSAGAYTGDFRDAMSKGEITADEFNNAILSLGNEPVAVEAATSTDTLEGAMGNLQATIVGGLSDAITSIKPMLTSVIGGFSELLGWVSQNSWVFAVIGGVIIGTLVPAMVAWATSIWASTTALLANPVVWIAIGIMALIAVIVLLVQNWDAVVAWIVGVWGGFLGWFNGVMNGFLGWWNGFWGAVGRTIADIWNNRIIGPVRNGIDAVGGFVQTGLNLIKGAWDGMWNGLGTVVKNIWNSILGWIEGGVNNAIGMINGMIKGVNLVGGAFGVHIDLIPKVHLPRLATGGVTTGPMMAIVGDNPGGREYIEPVDKVAQRLQQTAIETATRSQKGGSSRLHPDDIRAIGQVITEAMYPMIVKQTQVTVRAALGG